jgi:glycolate oxidase
VATVAALDDRILEGLAQIVGARHVLTSKTARYNRARTPAMFALHRWDEHVPQVVVLPATAAEVRTASA